MKTKNLSLAEAHASDRRYKPVGEHHTKYYRFDVGQHLSWFAATTLYELEPEAKLLTREEVYEAISSSMPVICTEYVATHICNKLFGSEEG